MRKSVRHVKRIWVKAGQKKFSDALSDSFGDIAPIGSMKVCALCFPPVNVGVRGTHAALIHSSA